MTEAACGTLSGYGAHRRLGEPTCQACRDAKAAYQRGRAQAAPACSIPDCDRPVVAKRLCSPHYQKAQRNGDPTMDARDIKWSFWDRVKVGTEPTFDPSLGPCWLWCGRRHETGYGSLGGPRQAVYAHRYAYEYMRAEIPEGLTIDHLCRVRNCVNPFHLEPVPRAENTRRAWAARKAESR